MFLGGIERVSTPVFRAGAQSATSLSVTVAQEDMPGTTYTVVADVEVTKKMTRSGLYAR